MFVTNWISPTRIQKISEITNFFRHYLLSRTEVYITKEEYDAISFCSEEITSLVEGGAEDEYVKEADNALRSIASIQRKYRKALKRENALQDAKAAVKKLHPELKGEFYNKLVKNVAEQLINGGKNGKD